MSYLDQLKARIAETEVGGSPTEPTQSGSVSFVGEPPRRISGPQAAATLRQWHAHLSSVDESTTPAGWTLDQWLKTLDASYWLYENFASQAVRDDWSASDLFGVLLQKPGWGGLADRLGDSRGLIMDHNQARWRSFGVPSTFARGGGNGFLVLWEASR